MTKARAEKASGTLTEGFAEIASSVTTTLASPAESRGPLLPSDDRFRVMHDVMSVHTATTREGFVARVYELFDAASEMRGDGSGVSRAVLAIAAPGEAPSVWELGVRVEAIVGLEVLGDGRLDVVVEPTFTHDDDEPVSNRITVGYTSAPAGLKDGALRVRHDRWSRLVPRSTARWASFLARVETVSHVELERDDLVAARVFVSRGAEGDPKLFAQLSDEAGTVRTFDLGEAGLERVRVAADGDALLVDAWQDGRAVRIEARGVGDDVVPARLVITKRVTSYERDVEVG